MPKAPTNTPLTAITTKAGWTSLESIFGSPIPAVILVTARSTGDSKTATLTIHGSIDGITSGGPVILAETLAQAKSMSVDTGTVYVNDDNDYRIHSFAILPGPFRYLWFDEAAANNDITYLVSALV